MTESNGHTPELQGVAPPERKKRKGSVYDMPTDQKRAFGRRLKEAREIAGISLTDAATQLGYSQPVQMSNMENGIRPPTLAVVIQCAHLYGTTTDYLCGLAEDSDRDPASGSSRWLAARIHADVEKIIREVVGVNVELMRKVMPTTADGQRMASAILEAETALRWAQANVKRFDDIRGMPKLVRGIEVGAESARNYQRCIARAIRLMAVRSMRDAAVADGGQPVDQLPLPIDRPAIPAVTQPSLFKTTT